MKGSSPPGGVPRPGRASVLVFLFVFPSIVGMFANAALPPSSDEQEYNRDYEEGVKPWKEIEAKVPAYPKEENLLPFVADAGSPHRYFIDGASLSLGEDGVVRYTLVVKTAGGAVNTTFEGMRCDLRQQKYYAVGKGNGNWAQARAPQWRRIEFRERNNHHGVLYTDILCYEKKTPGSVKEVVQLLKYGPPERER